MTWIFSAAVIVALGAARVWSRAARERARKRHGRAPDTGMFV